jgi:tetratricopeptide (TPR) repeat protein
VVFRPAARVPLLEEIPAMSRIARIEAMLQDAPDDAELRYMLAMEHASAGDDAAAVRCFEDLMARFPDYPPGYHMAGRALVRLGRIADAREVLERGIPAALRKNDQHAAGEMQELLNTLEE